MKLTNNVPGTAAAILIALVGPVPSRLMAQCPAVTQSSGTNATD
jgi:hypothetical protein